MKTHKKRDRPSKAILFKRQTLLAQTTPGWSP